MPAVYAAQTMPGLEMVAWDEVQKELRDVSFVKRAQGLVLFGYEGPARELLHLRTTEDVFVVVYHTADLPAHRGALQQLREGTLAGDALERALATHREIHPQRIKRLTYRVVAQKRGGHEFRRVDAEQAVQRALQGRYERWKTVPEDAHLEIWVHIQHQFAAVMLRLSDRTMRHRRYKLVHIPASLRPTIAAAMVRLSQPHDRDRFVDPMCGAGTILLERVFGGKAGLILGGDIDQAALTAAAENASPYPRIHLCHWDATMLPLPDQSVHKIVTNLPFGKQIGSPQGVARLYQRFFPEMARVLAPIGRAVLLSSERGLIEDNLQASPFRAHRMVNLTVMGQDAAIYVLEWANRPPGAGINAGG